MLQTGTLMIHSDSNGLIYVQAIAVDPTHVRSLYNYASLLHTVRHDLEGAKEYYELALKV